MKETPAEAQVPSHRLMLRAGLVHQTAAGIYAWLPLGHRVLRRIEEIIRQEQERADAIEMLMPTLQLADLWKSTGRYDAYGKEMLRFQDRHDREMIYGPTNEIMITDIFRSAVQSYRDLPRTLYHIQWKFRDEVRPRFGVLRGREFLMKDGYSFDLDFAGAKRSYDAMYASYLRTFRRIGLRVIAARAESGAIGGELSHEFLVLAETGESRVFYDAALDGLDVESVPPAELQAIYAATDDMHGKLPCDVPAERLVEAEALEVGHIFYFGDYYSKLLGATVMGPDGEPVSILSGSYGIGVSRMVGAIIEASHDEAGIVWPEAVAPFRVGLINLKVGDAACDGQSEALLDTLSANGIDTLYDDRDERPGAKFADMDLIGLPWQLVVGPRGLANGVVEMKNRRTGERQELSPESALARLTG